MTDEELCAGLDEFARKLVDSQQDLPPEFQKVLDEHFWELVAE